MDQSILVEDEVGEGRRFVERFAADGNPVSAAFWGKAVDEESRYLYVVTDLVERDGPAAAYRAVNATLRKLDHPWISGSEIRAIGPTSSIGKLLTALTAQHGGRAPGRLSGSTLHSVGIETAYLYPAHLFNLSQPNSMTSDEIGRELFRLMSRGPGTLQPSRITLKDGTTFHGVPFSLELGHQREMIVRFIEEREPTPRVVRLDEISSIA